MRVKFLVQEHNAVLKPGLERRPLGPECSAISHEFASLTREILLLPLEHKIHIFLPPCNILFIFLFVLKNISINFKIFQ